MTVLKKIVVDCSTGIQEELDLTPDEIAQLEADQAQAELDRAAAEAEASRLAALKTSAKAKLVAGEPLTTEEASLLIG
jgi:uncharacterized coiled-coil DUF342 family protein